MRFTSRWNWNLEMLVFMEGGKPESPEKNPRSKDESQQQTQPTYDTGTGIEPGPHWWKASALSTVPSLLPLTKAKFYLVNPSNPAKTEKTHGRVTSEQDINPVQIPYPSNATFKFPPPRARCTVKCPGYARGDVEVSN